ncbi:hypothetical protein BJ085DRAFT_32358 [Dimargaris cristalligena]|uniref:Uncharacterized protein n=1 Tax=Dimargaris cristalligena TaxID=215637 RepID=A0A4P9ZV75_9FUNG|nr:hypothetical protein BJ085DRAFT_32358 [Dimargaris cristalligena]|eukprot:RKP36821.1 hypothetical protein BJ085DRAFT_32358 [Dimargaris cristalligena]
MSSAPVSTMNPTPRKALAAKNHNYAFLKNRSNHISIHKYIINTALWLLGALSVQVPISTVLIKTHTPLTTWIPLIFPSLSSPTDKMVSPCTKKLEARHYAKPGILQPKSLTNMLVQAAQKPKAVVVSTPTNNTAAALDAK